MNEKIRAYVDEAKKDTTNISDDMIDIYHALLENQGKELQRVSEQTTTANIDRVATVFLPAIKKLARDSIINKVVGVQPIPDRVAIVQFLDYVYTGAAVDQDGGAIAAGASVIDNVSLAYSNDPGEGQNITSTIDFVLREEGVKARQRKLAGKWTFEAGDATSKLGINVEQEITKALSSKIVEETNFEVLNDLYAKATGSTSLSWTAPLAGDAPDVKARKEKELYFVIVDAAAEMYNKTRRYPNFVVCNPKVAAYFKRTGEYVGPTAEKGQVSMLKRLFLAGTLNDEFAMYVVPNLSTNKLLIGYKGNSEIEVGGIYAPYIPLIVMDSFYNVENWSWIRSVGSFYAKSYPMTDLYGTVTVNFS
jgi:hypothetical protein